MPCLAVDVKAAPTAGERGSFVALVSTYARDRSNEVIMPGAFAASLERWRASAKMIPVLADHEGKIENVVGHIDPRLTHETPEGLQATGVLDLSTPLGKRVYDLVKGGSLAWSIGFTMSPRARHQHGDVIELSGRGRAHC